MAGKEIITLRAAAQVADVSHETIRKWCVIYGIGDNTSGRWSINRRRLLEIVKAKQAVSALRAPRVPE